MGRGMRSIALVILTMTALVARDKDGAKSVRVPRDILDAIVQESQDELTACAFGQAQPVKPKEVFVAELQDLDGDGKPEYVVHGKGCVCRQGNCPFWVYFHNSTGFAQLLDGGSLPVRSVSVLKTRTNGYLDLEVAQGTAERANVVVYQYDGSHYEATHCFERNYRGPDGGELREPRVRQRDCPFIRALDPEMPKLRNRIVPDDAKPGTPPKP